MEDIVITITCPVCTKEFREKAKELKDGTVIKCPKCGEKTTIRGNMFTDMAKSTKDGPFE
jgi:DNA-directed RNA polymerase subunit RPC12/RpoP